MIFLYVHISTSRHLEVLKLKPKAEAPFLVTLAAAYETRCTRGARGGFNLVNLWGAPWWYGHQRLDDWLDDVTLYSWFSGSFPEVVFLVFSEFSVHDGWRKTNYANLCHVLALIYGMFEIISSKSGYPTFFFLIHTWHILNSWLTRAPVTYRNPQTFQDVWRTSGETVIWTSNLS